LSWFAGLLMAHCTGWNTYGPLQRIVAKHPESCLYNCTILRYIWTDLSGYSGYPQVTLSTVHNSLLHCSSV